MLCVETAEHVRDLQLFLSESAGCSRPAGVALTTPAHGRRTGLGVLLRGFERSFNPRSPHVRFFTARSLRELLDEMGFERPELRRAGGSLAAVARRP